MQLKQHSASDSPTGDWLASICLPRTPFARESKYQHFTWSTVESDFQNSFPQKYVTNLLQLCYTTDTDTNTPTFSSKHTERTIASPQSPHTYQVLLSAWFTHSRAHISLSHKVRNRLKEIPRKLSILLFFCTKGSRVQPDSPHKMSTWLWSLSEEQIQNHSWNTVFYPIPNHLARYYMTFSKIILEVLVSALSHFLIFVKIRASIWDLKFETLLYHSICNTRGLGFFSTKFPRVYFSF